MTATALDQSPAAVAAPESLHLTVTRLADGRHRLTVGVPDGDGTTAVLTSEGTATVLAQQAEATVLAHLAGWVADGADTTL